MNYYNIMFYLNIAMVLLIIVNLIILVFKNLAIAANEMKKQTKIKIKTPKPEAIAASKGKNSLISHSKSLSS